MSETQHTNHSETERRHLESRSRYPDLGISSEEYVIIEAERHPIGLVSIWMTVVIVLLLTFVALPLYAGSRESLADSLNIGINYLPSAQVLSIPLFIASALFVIGGFLASKVYSGNRFYLTNESIIQRVQKSIFNIKDQTINLVNVEDVSYDKRGILQHLLNFGDLRLSTQGEETTYHFYTVKDPARIAQAVNNASENAMQELENPSATER